MISKILPQSVDAVESRIFLAFDNGDVTGEGGFETRSGWIYTSLFFSCLKNRFVQEKIPQILVPILKPDFVSSQSPFI